MNLSNPLKVTYGLFINGVIAVIMHNAIYGLFNIEEPVFFIIGIVATFAFFVSVIVNMVLYCLGREPFDLWKLGFLGVFGLFSVIMNFEELTLFYAFFGFFGFGLSDSSKRVYFKRNKKDAKK